MSANQCERINLGNPQIYESFSVCSIQDSGTYNDPMVLAIKKCCTNPIKSYQCWDYCQVEESMFPTWLDCVHSAANTTWGSSCQRADQSPVLTATRPYPASFDEPPPPLDYTYPPAPKSTKAEVKAVTTSSAISSPTTGVNSAIKSTLIATASPTSAPKSGSTKVLELSMGGVLCAVLLLSTIAV